MERTCLPILTGMKTPYETHIQFHIQDGIGPRLVNAAVLKKLRHSTTGKERFTLKPTLTGDVLADMIALGSGTLVDHTRRLIRNNPLETIVHGDKQIRVRVCGALDYVIDRAKRSVWVEPAPLSAHERSAKESPPWHHPFCGPLDLIDILNPLSRHSWLVYVAARPAWFGYAFARHDDGQHNLFVQQSEMTYAHTRVTWIAWQQVRDDYATVALRHQLAGTLALHIGAGLVNLAMQARFETRRASLNARHLKLVWQHQAAFETMQRENPRLLPALTVWLQHDKYNNQARLADALPQMRQDVLASGLPPKAWRYLAQHGIKRLLSNQLHYSPWTSLLTSLRTLNAARWPTLPPRGFLRLLEAAAGQPESYESAGTGVPGWFWQVACDEADARRGDTVAYLDLSERIPLWAWLTRELALKPDKSQRRKGIAWLREVAQAHEQLVQPADAPAWAFWLLPAQWNCASRLTVVPLLTPVALLHEAIALHNCADTYANRCHQGTHLLLSLRDDVTGKRVALACLERRNDRWILGQVAGPCNKPVSRWVRWAATHAAKVVSYHHSQHLNGQKSPPAMKGRPAESL